MAQQQAEEDRNCAKVAARVDELETLLSGNKDLVGFFLGKEKFLLALSKTQANCLRHVVYKSRLGRVATSFFGRERSNERLPEL